MALGRILKRRRDVDQAGLDDLRLIVLARLAAEDHDTAADPAVPDQRPVVLRRVNGDAPGGVIAHPVVGSGSRSPATWLLDASLEDQRADAASNSTPRSADLPTDADDDGPPRPMSAEARAALRQGRRSGRADATEPRRADATKGPAAVTSADPLPVDPTACCPYCAVRLEPPPVTDESCPRCGQRMIVRSVGARVAILAEAVLPFFEAERLNEERWARDRERWLELARERGARGDQVPRPAGELISEADVAAARAWYMTSADRAFRLAARDRRWEEAATIRYEQAGVLSRIAGSAKPPSDELVRLHRDGVAAELQAIGEVARDAQVRGESCCEACRADDRRIVQIAEELRSPTLPHDGCPNGLCGCRWFLTARDQDLLAALLRRQIGADPRTADPTR